MGRNAKGKQSAARDAAAEVGRHGEVAGADLEPIGVVQRELTRPDGSTVVVEVPVYPPFRLAEKPATRMPARDRVTPTLKKKRGRTRGPREASG